MFFTHLDQVLTQGVDLNITVSKSDSGMIVLLMPKLNGLKDPAQNHIVPLRLAGQPQELDANFFPHITQPVQKVSGLLVSMEQFEQQAEKAAAESRAAKQKKDAEAKSAKAKKEAEAKPGNEKKDKYESYMKKSEDHEAAGNLDASLLSLQQARLHAEGDQTKTVDERITAIKNKMSQGSLFDTSPAQPQPQQTVTPQSTQSQPETINAVPAPPAPANAVPAQVHDLFYAAQQVQPTPQAHPPQGMPQIQTPQQQMPPVQAIPQQQEVQSPPQQQMAQPMQQSAQHQPGGIQPNVQGFGMFGQQPANVPPSPPPQQQSPVMQEQLNSPVHPGGNAQGIQDNVPNYDKCMAAPVCRENEYDSYPDFPPEMAPPVYNHQFKQL